MSDIKCQLVLGRHFDFAGKHALGKRAARVILKHLSDAPKLVDETSHASIRRADHWPTRFYAAKNCIRQVLMRSSGPLKPAVVRHIYEQVRTRTRLAWKDKLSGELANRVFETNQRRHMDLAVGQSEHGVFCSFFEIARHLIAYNLRKQRHCMSTGNIFAKRHQVDLSIYLHAFAAIGNKHRRVVNVSPVYVDRSQQKVRVCRRGQIHHEFIALLICENRPGHGALRPNQQIRWWICAQRDFAQSAKLIEDSPGKLRIELLILRNVRLHRGNAERFCGRRNLRRTESKNQNAHDARHCDGEIKMRSHHACARLHNQAICGRENDHVGKRNHERQPRNTSELCDLNQRPIVV